jgi:hypothetical protein
LEIGYELLEGGDEVGSRRRGGVEDVGFEMGDE